MHCSYLVHQGNSLTFASTNATIGDIHNYIITKRHEVKEEKGNAMSLTENIKLDPTFFSLNELEAATDTECTDGSAVRSSR